MSIWRPRDGKERASPHTLDILGDVERGLSAFAEPRPVVSSIRIGAGLADLHDFEVEIAFAPGAILAIRYQSVDEEGRDPDSLENEAGAVAWLAIDQIRECDTLGFGRLADLLHDARMQARKEVAGWWPDGITARFGDVRLVSDEYWGPRDMLKTEARIQCIDERLRHTITTVESDHPDELAAELASWRPTLKERYASLAELAAQGADGMVDQLVLNALAFYGDDGTTLGRFRTGQPYRWFNDLTIFAQDNRLRCHGKDGDLQWNRNSVTVFGRSAPDTVLITLIGQPVTRLVEHPVLSDDMIVTEAHSKFAFDVHSIYAEFEQPQRLFCSASGRVWDADRQSACRTAARDAE
ncbi:hypothetical protein QH494_12465 [Sphingomonas sp. AR_OL41]|uniref:hypothetical protein n=1 Tax=Sphingomonas sp. AR_OL41 TaxID=3042729 RepID=UPI00248162C1|nr:hypothetical protein [Sphingomonas sp. AR_OL41]MDH7972992.1 hypothetical protein [Sphingomonas sp. AR_OL41]